MKRQRDTASQSMVATKRRRHNDVPSKKVIKNAILRSLETKVYSTYDATVGGDQFWSSGQSPNAGIQLFPQVQGDQYYQYVGLRITPTYLKIKWMVQFNNTGANIFNNVMIVAIQWKGAPPTIGAAPAVTDISQQGGGYISPLAGWDFINRDNLRILRVTNLTLDQYHPTATGTWKIPTFPVDTIRYINASGDVNDGGVYLYAISDSAYPSTLAPFFQYYSQLFYKDA